MKYLLDNPHGRTWLFLRSYISKAALVSRSIAATTTPRDIGPNEVEWGYLVPQEMPLFAILAGRV